MKKRAKGKPVFDVIAQSVATRRLLQAITKQKIALYMSAKKEDIEELLIGIARTLSLIGYASELDPNIPDDDLQLRILRGGLSACQQCIQTKWDPLQARAIDQAFDAALDLKKRLDDRYIDRAFVLLSSQ